MSRPGGRARRRRRRLPRQAVRARRAARAACARCCAGRACRATTSSLRVADLTLDPGAPSGPWRRASSSSPRPSSTCSSCSCATPGSSLDQTTIYDRIWGYDFGPRRRSSTSTSATSGARPRGRGEPRADPHRPRGRATRCERREPANPAGGRAGDPGRAGHRLDRLVQLPGHRQPVGAEIDRSLPRPSRASSSARPRRPDRRRLRRLGGHDLPPSPTSWSSVQVLSTRRDGVGVCRPPLASPSTPRRPPSPARRAPAWYRTVTATGGALPHGDRALIGDPGAIQVARSLCRELHVCSTRCGTARSSPCGLVVAGAALLGWLVIARRLTRRLVRLTSTAEEVEATGRLDVDVPVQGAGRGRPPRRGLQRNARRAGALEGRPAAPRAGRRARAAHAAHQPAHQHLGATPLRPAERAARTAHRRDLDSETRRAHRPGERDSSSWPPTTGGTSPSETVVSGRAGRAGRGASSQRRSGRTRSRSMLMPRPSAAAPWRSNGRCRISSTTRPSSTRTRADRGRGPRRPGRSPRPRPRARPGRRAPRVRPLLPGDPRAETLPGSGLGLAIVSQIATLHGGTVAGRRA